MGRTRNKHGLSDYRPKEVERQIRREAGFGCVVCAAVIVEYEHIDPEFHEAKEHDPKKMTLLCPTCNQSKKKGILTKEDIWHFKANPKTLENGHAFRHMYGRQNVFTVNTPGSQFRNVYAPLIFNKIPYLWFDLDDDGNQPPLLNFVFRAEDGSIPLCIKQNEMRVFQKEYDIVQKNDRITITLEKKICLEILINLNGGFSINEMHTVAPDGSAVTISKGEMRLGGISMIGTQANMAYTLIDSRFVNDCLHKLTKSLIEGQKLSAEIEARKHQAEAFYYHQDDSGVFPLFWIRQGRAFDCQGQYWGQVRENGINFTEEEFQKSEIPMPRFYYEKADDGTFYLNLKNFL